MMPAEYLTMQLKYSLEKHVVILNRGRQALAHLWLSKLKEPVNSLWHTFLPSLFDGHC